MSPDGAPSTNTAGALTRVMKIVNEKGLHARASAKFVQMVEKFDARITVSRGGESAGGDSIMGLMMLAAGPGTDLEIIAKGADAAAAVAALVKLVTDRFDESE